MSFLCGWKSRNMWPNRANMWNIKTPKGTFLSLNNARKLSFCFSSAQTRLIKKAFSTVLDLYKKFKFLLRPHGTLKKYIGVNTASNIPIPWSYLGIFTENHFLIFFSSKKLWLSCWFKQFWQQYHVNLVMYPFIDKQILYLARDICGKIIFCISLN